MLRAVRSVPEDVWEATPHRIRVGGGGLLVFDSAYPGDGLPSTCGDGADVPWLEVAIPPGTYEVDIADFEPDNSTRLILHRLRRGRPACDVERGGN